MNEDEKYMNEAIKLAKKCKKNGDVPVGCVIVKNNKIIGKGFNERNKKNNSLKHAEIIAIDKACKKVKDWMLVDSVMYVTLEPCIMCAGAIIQARIKKVVYGTSSDKNGCFGTILSLDKEEKMMHKVEIKSNVCEEECKNLMKDFFKDLRENKII